MCTGTIFCWNVRGFNKLSHHSGFKNWIRNKDFLFGSLLETHVQSGKQKKLLNAVLPGWLYDSNYAFSDLGKIWITWHPSVKVDVLSKSLQMISCEDVLSSSSPPVIVCFVYASTDDMDRRLFWSELTSLAADQRVMGKPWAVFGDFNQVLRPSENSAAIGPNIDLPTRLFAESLNQCALADVTYRGSSNTWWNKRRLEPIAKKLDRVLVNDDWLCLFPLSLAVFGEPAFSDHASMSLALQSGAPKQKKPFRFFNYLLKNEDFLPLVAHHWFSYGISGTAMFRVARKLKTLKKAIRDFSRQNFSDIEKRVKEASEDLAAAQIRTLNDPSVENAQLELDLQQRWITLSTAEESFFYQRSRITWLTVGDRNTPFSIVWPTQDKLSITYTILLMKMVCDLSLRMIFRTSVSITSPTS